MAKKNDNANKPVYKDIYKDFDDEVIPDEFITFILEGGELKRNKDYQFIENKDGSMVAMKCPSTKKWCKGTLDCAFGCVGCAYYNTWLITKSQKKEAVGNPLHYDDEIPTQQRIRNITEAMKDLLLYKNQKYGDAAINPLCVFTKHLKKVEANTASILVRLDDKLSRVKNADELRTNDISDIIGYCTLLLISMGVTAEDIAKFKD